MQEEGEESDGKEQMDNIDRAENPETQEDQLY